MKKLKIVIAVTNNTFTDQRMQRIARSLSNAGYEMSFIGHHRAPFIQNKTTSGSVKLIKTIFKRGPLFYLEYNVKLFLNLMVGKFDAVYSVDLDTIMGARYASFLKNKKIIFDAHEYFTETPELNNRNFIKKVWRFIKKLALWKIDLAITVNEKLAEIMAKEDRIPFHVIRNLPNHSFENNDMECNKILIYQGAINKGRAIETYIQAMDYLQEYQLWIIGTGDLDDEIIHLIKESSSKKRIHFFGPMSPIELQKKTKQAGIGLNLLDDTSKSYYYSLANKFFDYIQAGIPSVNMNFPVYTEYIKKYQVGEIMSVMDAKLLVQMIRYMAQPKQYRSYKKHILTAAKELNWNNEEDKLVSLVKKIL